MGGSGEIFLFDKKDKKDKKEKMVSQFGVDIDTKKYEDYCSAIKKCEQYGLVADYPTNHGWHFKVYLTKNVTLWESFQMRYDCGDDYHRLCRDMLKTIWGARTMDVLFDTKQVYHKSVLEL